MSFRSTTDLLAALKTRVESLPLDTDAPLGARLFELVSYYKTSDIARAFQDLYITKSRICLIVPVGFRHKNDADRLRVFSIRYATVDFLFGDRSFDKASMAAAIGGTNNVGVIEMAERVIDSLFDTPLTLTDLETQPDEGAPLLLTSEENPNDPGRNCWVQTVHFRAGLRRAAYT